jgi:hypothetical protein
MTFMGAFEYAMRVRLRAGFDVLIAPTVTVPYLTLAPTFFTCAFRQLRAGISILNAETSSGNDL